jgi:hypothetical protein
VDHRGTDAELLWHVTAPASQDSVYDSRDSLRSSGYFILFIFSTIDFFCFPLAVPCIIVIIIIIIAAIALAVVFLLLHVCYSYVFRISELTIRFAFLPNFCLRA